MGNDENKKNDSMPLSESNVSLRLADIQRRCARLLDDPDSDLELSLEEPVEEPVSNEYYRRD